MTNRFGGDLCAGRKLLIVIARNTVTVRYKEPTISTSSISGLAIARITYITALLWIFEISMF
jgi:hypothetical protein